MGLCFSGGRAVEGKMGGVGDGAGGGAGVAWRGVGGLCFSGGRAAALLRGVAVAAGRHGPQAPPPPPRRVALPPPAPGCPGQPAPRSIRERRVAKTAAVKTAIYVNTWSRSIRERRTGRPHEARFCRTRVPAHAPGGGGGGGGGRLFLPSPAHRRLARPPSAPSLSVELRRGLSPAARASGLAGAPPRSAPRPALWRAPARRAPTSTAA